METQMDTSSDDQLNRLYDCPCRSHKQPEQQIDSIDEIAKQFEAKVMLQKAEQLT